MSTSIEALAQSIIDLTQKGPIPGGVGANIRGDAELILAAFDWVDCADRLPVDLGTYWGERESGKVSLVSLCRKFASDELYWHDTFYPADAIIKWRALL